MGEGALPLRPLAESLLAAALVVAGLARAGRLSLLPAFLAIPTGAALAGLAALYRLPPDQVPPALLGTGFALACAVPALLPGRAGLRRRQVGAAAALAAASGALLFTALYCRGLEVLLAAGSVGLDSASLAMLAPLLLAVGAGAVLSLVLAGGGHYRRRADLVALHRGMVPLLALQVLLDGAALQFPEAPILARLAEVLPWAVFLLLGAWLSRGPLEAPLQRRADRRQGSARRLLRSRAAAARRWRTASTVALAALAFPLLADPSAWKRQDPPEPAREVAVADGQVEVPLAWLDGGPVMMAARVDGATVRFFAMRTASRRCVVVQDACEICGPGGYDLGGGVIVCRPCGARINPESVGRPGGCNPVPVPSRREGDRLRVRARDLVPRARN